VSFLADIGFLGPDVILTHALHVGEHDDRDLESLAHHGISIAHCPVVMRRSGHLLRSFSRYRRAGLNIGLGTATFLPDILEEMRWASIGSKVADRHAASGLAREVFEATGRWSSFSASSTTIRRCWCATLDGAAEALRELGLHG
jgi:cytosine/adenosine deaminase-related metal-dependent hydrolase